MTFNQAATDKLPHAALPLSLLAGSVIGKCLAVGLQKRTACQRGQSQDQPARILRDFEQKRPRRLREFLQPSFGPLQASRKKDSEAAPLALVRLGGHATSMSLRDALHDREAKAGAAPTSVGLPIRLAEGAPGPRWGAR